MSDELPDPLHPDHVWPGIDREVVRRMGKLLQYPATHRALFTRNAEGKYELKEVRRVDGEAQSGGDAGGAGS